MFTERELAMLEDALDLLRQCAETEEFYNEIETLQEKLVDIVAE